MTTETRNDTFYSHTLVRFSHCDPAGIVFFPHYFVLFNGLVEDWFNDALNINYANFITTRRLGLPIVNIKCDFMEPSMIGEIITLTLKLDHIRHRSFALDIRAMFEDRIRVWATHTLCVIDRGTGRAVSIPDDLRVRFTEFQQGKLG